MDEMARKNSTPVPFRDETMLKHYLKEISALEFSERNMGIQRSVAKERGSMNSRGLLNSSMTLQAMADFFSAEFQVRCDFLKNFIVSHASLLSQNSESDDVTVAKTVFQTTSFEERDKIKALYQSSIKTIADSLLNGSMSKQIEEAFTSSMEARINKNNMYVEIAYQTMLTIKTSKNPVFLLQPNFNGIGVDLVELWNRYVK